ncbi:hypothetical protein Gasu2_42810 [Galdieria sulphuraria]|nr:hypothetical protein Gasu2_42810 [Galdieria sulphuraria]
MLFLYGLKSVVALDVVIFSRVDLCNGRNCFVFSFPCFVCKNWWLPSCILVSNLFRRRNFCLRHRNIHVVTLNFEFLLCFLACEAFLEEGGGISSKFLSSCSALASRDCIKIFFLPLSFVFCCFFASIAACFKDNDSSSSQLKLSSNICSSFSRSCNQRSDGAVCSNLFISSIFLSRSSIANSHSHCQFHYHFLFPLLRLCCPRQYYCCKFS